MAGTLPAGPFGRLGLGGHDVPYYVIPFDKEGVLQAPATATRLVSDVAASMGNGDAGPAVTDVIIIVHGWNTDFNGALALAREMVRQLDATIAAKGAPRADFRPLIVSVFWPSVVLSGSMAPAMAAASREVASRLAARCVEPGYRRADDWGSTASGRAPISPRRWPWLGEQRSMC